MDFNKVLAILQEKEDMEESIQIPVSALKSKAGSAAIDKKNGQLALKGKQLVPKKDLTGKDIPGKYDLVPVNRTTLNAMNTINKIR